MAGAENKQALPQEVPVYLFTGFLEGGKTRFIQESLQDKGFDSGERTLLLVCEEGELEYAPEKFRGRVEILNLDDENALTPAYLAELDRSRRPERVLVEYNGMWMLDTLYRALPGHWSVFQEFCFAEAGSFLNYNANMRQLVYDKLKSCDLVVFNRFDRSQDVMPWHKIVRAANRACDIAYEDLRGKVRYDEIIDPLPFDKNAPVIEVGDRDYALWYRDLVEDMRSYNGKTVRFKAQSGVGYGLRAGEILVGRPLMNCCAADVAFAGLVAQGNKQTPEVKLGDWFVLTASVRIARHPGYEKLGPVLRILDLQPAPPPEDPVASFY